MDGEFEGRTGFTDLQHELTGETWSDVARRCFRIDASFTYLYSLPCKTFSGSGFLSGSLLDRGNGFRIGLRFVCYS